MLHPRTPNSIRSRRPFVAALGLGLWAVCGACASSEHRGTAPSARDADATAAEIRAFGARIATEVTAKGPLAWNELFCGEPHFFMAAEGSMAFASGADARDKVEALAHQLKHIEFRWSEAIRVDVLSPDLAMMAAPYFERREGTGGPVEERGFFTGLAERGSAGWRLRDAHWSVVHS